MDKILAFLIILCTYQFVGAQSNTFCLTDTTFAKGSVYTCPLFDFYNSCNNKYNRIQIDSIKNFLRPNKTIKIQISCHTDQRRSAEYNKLLSEKYAKGIKETLVDSTISTDRISTFGFGESKPIVDIKTIEAMKTTQEKEQAYSKNRRIEIMIIDL